MLSPEGSRFLSPNFSHSVFGIYKLCCLAISINCEDTFCASSRVPCWLSPCCLMDNPASNIPISLLSLSAALFDPNSAHIGAHFDRLLNKAWITFLPYKTSSHFRDCLPLRATNGTRTRDLRLGKPTLYQLSYCRLFLMTCKYRKDISIDKHIPQNYFPLFYLRIIG